MKVKVETHMRWVHGTIFLYVEIGRPRSRDTFIVPADEFATVVGEQMFGLLTRKWQPVTITMEVGDEAPHAD